jgi:hypothetical protein
LNLELVQDIATLQVAHLQQVKPRLSQGERLQRRVQRDLAKRRRRRMPERQVIDMVPDNVTDLDLQNQLVDSVHDEELVVVSHRPSEPSTAEELLMCNHKLSDLYNRQR